MQWEKVEPILRTIYAQLDNQYMTSGETVVAAIGCSEDEARIAFDTLRKGGYISVQGENAAGIPFIIEAAPLGLQYCSDWPSDANGAQAFLEALIAAAETRAVDPETPAEERGRLSRFAGAAKGAVPDLIDIAIKVGEKRAGL